jgi:L-aspartate oxidase
MTSPVAAGRFDGVSLRGLPSARVTWDREADVVVVGAGAAGISAALEAAAWGRKVLLVVKGRIGGGSTPLAQGGLAAVLGAGDSVDLHHADTIVAGAGLCDDGAVAALVAAAPGEIARLAALGARFDPGLGLEGGHSRRRIIHAGGDATGAEVHRVLVAALLTSDVEVLEDTAALDALVDDSGAVVGLRVGRGAGPLEVGTIHAGAVVLATGGFGQAYATTTNPLGATGDGMALAARAGAELCDVEFVQFHPTVLWQAGGRGQRPLVTEALRGAGAALVDVRGRSVMAGVHPAADLAPRDVVAAAIHRRMTTGEGPSSHVWLDATGVGRGHLTAHFPAVTAACQAIGIDPSVQPIPVAPGAHYACGGVRADMTGETSLPGLYAVGEVAATGVHGANRLASNSLTEAVAMGRRLGQLLGRLPRGSRRDGRPPAAGIGAAPGSRDALADAMSRHAGVLRDGEGLEHLIGRLAAAPGGGSGSLDLPAVEATNLHTISTLVAAAALVRTESRGSHRRRDAPESSEQWAHRNTWTWRDGELRVEGHQGVGVGA